MLAIIAYLKPPAGFALGGWLLAGLCLLLPAVWAQTGLESLLPGGEGQQPEKNNTAIPQPEDLSGSWWSWLLADNGNLQQERVNQLLTSLLDSQDLQTDSRQQALESFKLSLAAISKQFDRNPAAGSAVTFEVAVPQTFPAFFSLPQSRADLAHRIKRRRSEADVSRALLTQMDADHNRLTSRYRKLRAPADQWQFGLQLMASRAQMERVKLRVHQLESSLEELEQQSNAVNAINLQLLQVLHLFSGQEHIGAQPAHGGTMMRIYGGGNQRIHNCAA